MKSVVVTGCSTGIGYGTAEVLTHRGFRVFGSVRKAADGARLARELGGNFVPLVFDITDEDAVRRAAEKVKAQLGGETLFGLVNNAGIAVPAPLLYVDPADFRTQLEVNLTGVLLVTQSFAPLLFGEKPGRIVNISSVGGRGAAPFNGPYSASKFALEGFSEALRREMMIFGVDAIVIAPGAVKTAIWEKVENTDLRRFADTVYAPALAKARAIMHKTAAAGLAAEHLGRAALTALTARRPKTRYTVTPDPLTYYFLRALPKRWADRLIAWKLGLLPVKN
jgi:NAD(P)-dependent dehydrogenase (short-subunit alcohol dehydrogenase family)